MQKSSRYAIETIDGITIVRMHEKASLDDVRSAFNDLSKSEPSNPRLWHLERGWNLTTAQIRSFAQYSKSKSVDDIKLAVVTNENLSYGLARMFQAYWEDPRMSQQNFATEEAAITWLKE